MRFAKGIVPFVLVLGFVGARPGWCDPITPGYVRLEGRSGFPNVDHPAVENGGLTGTQASMSITRGSHSATGRVEVDGKRHGIDLEATGSASFGYMAIEGRAEWTDSMRLLDNLVSESNRATYDSTDLIVTYRLTGRLEASYNVVGGQDNATLQWLLGVSGAPNAIVNGRAEASAGGPPGLVNTVVIDRALSMTIPWNVAGTYGFYADLRGRAVAYNGWASVDVGDTLELQSVLFADGTRPEDLGYVLQFDSGITSPNIDPVPEPASLALFGIGTVGLAAWRRKRPKP